MLFIEDASEPSKNVVIASRKNHIHLFNLPNSPFLFGEKLSCPQLFQDFGGHDDIKNLGMYEPIVGYNGSRNLGMYEPIAGHSGSRNLGMYVGSTPFC